MLGPQAGGSQSIGLAVGRRLKCRGRCVSGLGMHQMCMGTEGVTGV